jgi:hypothetical protein
MTTGSSGVAQTRQYRRVNVEKVVSSRYCQRGAEQSGMGWPERPDSWDQRLGGLDVIIVDGGETLRLASTPMQSPPKPGWVLMLTGGDAGQGFTWTLYGMPRSQ